AGRRVRDVGRRRPVPPEHRRRGRAGDHSRRGDCEAAQQPRGDRRGGGRADLAAPRGRGAASAARGRTGGRRIMETLHPDARKDPFGSKINRTHSTILAYGIPWLTIMLGSLAPWLPIIA